MGYTLSICLWILSLGNVLQNGSSLPYNKEECFEDLGCFSNEAPFNNTLGRLPRQNDDTFRIITDKCRGSHILNVGKNTYTSACKYDPELPLKIVVHGFQQNSKNKWISDVVTALLKKEEMTIITVDWGQGADLPYLQAVANSRLVAAKISRLIKIMEIPPKKIHIIGYSLGAHIAGYVGEDISGIRRITGLDPAEPNFSNTDSVVHLEKTDAEFVDIIHTDILTHGSGVGWIEDSGHIDFYPNGGKNQPGCSGTFDMTCSHHRSTQLFIESINTDYPFYGYPCESIDDLESNRGNCLTCSRGVCPEMGYNADKSNSRGKYYLLTREEAPFSGYTRHVEVEFGQMEDVKGQIIVEMIDKNRASTSIVIGSDKNSFRSGNRRGNVAVIRQIEGEIIKIRIKYKQYWNLYSFFGNSDKHVVINKVKVTSAENGRSIYFCGGNITLGDGNSSRIERSSTDPNECNVTPTEERYIPTAVQVAKLMASSLLSTNITDRFFPKEATTTKRSSLKT
ncbi:pancreatic lipase-related protein 2-like [Ruditapes philippinarum]|uniref:pancreatic lipase-related protein 2-like n=1 Tax=Ruditapes philippinarum TaxID=129788 RepID=UPI00295B9155|nr:pancreatic lipase-related protein 2-like [Ruditapes philippinarum]